MADLKLKTKDGIEYTIESPPELTEEIIAKLDKTAYHMNEISKMWEIPNLGYIGTEAIDEFNPFSENIKDDHEMMHRVFLHNWYQKSPFVPLFFNETYHTLLIAKILELAAKEGR